MDVGPGPSAEELLVRAGSRPGLVCLRGDFADGCPVLTSHPARVLEDGRRPPDMGFCADSDAASLDASGVVPVAGGWFGVLGYDEVATRFAFYDHVVRLVAGRWRFEALWTAGRAAALDALRRDWSDLITSTGPAQPVSSPSGTVGEFDGPDAHDHLAAVERAIELIRAGDLYQVNVCTRLRATIDMDPVAMFAAAAQGLDPAFGAFVGPARRGAAPAEESAVACLSPELYLRRRGREVLSAPIKGTGPCGPGSEAVLRESEKDVAENVMIVDLVRNDLGAVCETGTVRVLDLLSVVARVGVLHLVSEIGGTLGGGVADSELIAATFPPGSVTGAPKLRALEAIADLEPMRRGAYTGAVGFLSPSWGVELAVGIRTFEMAHGRVELGVGGGVTADSVPQLEWAECMHKARPIVSAVGGSIPTRYAVSSVTPTESQRAGGVLETVLVVDGEPVRLPDHLARMARSCRELFGYGLPRDADGRARRAAAAAPRGRAAMRLVARPDGTLDLTVSVAAPRRVVCDAISVTRPRSSWRHKWADRSWAVDAEAIAARDDAVPLFLGDDGVVLETSRGNVFLIDDDGALVTPPLRDDLLPGITRRALLDHARDTGWPTRLQIFDLVRLRGHPAFWTSSLSGAVAIDRVDGYELPRAEPEIAARVQALLGGSDGERGQSRAGTPHGR